LNIFESAIKVLKNSDNIGDENANDPLGVQTLASFFENSCKKIRIVEGVKFASKIVGESDDDDDDYDDNPKDQVLKNNLF
jgi:hypothetical protein